MRESALKSLEYLLAGEWILHRDSYQQVTYGFDLCLLYAGIHVLLYLPYVNLLKAHKTLSDRYLFFVYKYSWLSIKYANLQICVHGDTFLLVERKQ